jgi:hypothetical protein
MELPKVRNLNKGKRRRKKHKYKVNDAVAIKWMGEREFGFIEALTFDKEKYATYSIRSLSTPGCIYHDIHIDDPLDLYCYISSELTDTIKTDEVNKVLEYLAERKRKNTPVTIKKIIKNTKSTKNTKREIDIVFEQQKDFLNHKNFW